MQRVVACILKKKNQILISSRPQKKEYSGFYEFPGGKVKNNELLLKALKRELSEELSIKINLNKVIFLKSYSIKRVNNKICIFFFICNKWFGKIKPLEDQSFKWTLVEKLTDENMLVSNKKIIEYLEFLISSSNNWTK